MTATVTHERPDEQSVDWHGLSADEVCRRLDVDPAVGLTADEVIARRESYGPNKLAEEAKEPGWKAFLRQYRDLMQLVLVGAAAVSVVALQDFSTAIVVLALTVLNALMGLHQEGKAAESVAALRQMLIITASVRRNGERVQIPAEELVPGDIVGFEAGDKVAADGRLLVAARLEIEEAGLTGESIPAAKRVDAVTGSDVALGDRVDMAYMNSQVTRGRGEKVVTVRAHWDQYMQAYEDAITATSTAWAPWYVLPADNKHVMQAMTAAIIVDTITSLELQYPTVSDKDRDDNAKARAILETEPE